jgi:hypothetical protein
LWRIIRRRAKWPLIEYLIFQMFCFVAAIFMRTLRPETFHWGDNPIWAIFPPLGAVLILDGGDSGSTAALWLTAAIPALLTYFLLLQLSASAYWRRLWALYRETRRAPISPPAS